MKFFKLTWAFLTSRNTGIVLLILVALVLVIAASLPNPALMSPADAERLKVEAPFLFRLGENFNSMKTGKSYAFGAIGILLIISTTFCSIDRMMKRRRSEKFPFPGLPERAKGTSVKLAHTSQRIEEELSSILERDRWKLGISGPAGNRTISARKGDIGFWGSIFFHGILITLITGLIVYYLSGFHASLVFTEGQELRLEEKNLSRVERIPALGINLPDLRFMFNSFSAEYYNDYTATDYTADFDIMDLKTGRIWKQLLKVNEPFRYGGLDFLIILQGYSPDFVLYKNGVPVFDSYVALNFGEGNKDSFKVQGEGLEITAQFFPDMARGKDGGVYSRSPRPKNPYFGLDITKNGARVYRGLLGKGGDAVFGEYMLVFKDLRHWITLDLVRETGLGLFFVCSMLGLAGVLLRVLDPERKLFVNISHIPEGTAATFYAYSGHFEGMLGEHTADIIDRLKNSVERSGNVQN